MQARKTASDKAKLFMPCMLLDASLFASLTLGVTLLRRVAKRKQTLGGDHPACFLLCRRRTMLVTAVSWIIEIRCRGWVQTENANSDLRSPLQPVI